MARTNPPFSNWHTTRQGLEFSSQDFFSLLESAIKEKKLKDIKLSRIKMGEGGVFSASREYLRVSRKRMVFDICGAPFGNGFFVSWWQADIPSGLVSFLYDIPVVSWFVGFFERMVAPETYYSYDTRIMYQSLVHSAVVEVVDQISKDKGLRALNEDEKKPIMKNFFTQ